MAATSQYWLLDDAGRKFPLNWDGAVFLRDVTGLGTSNNANFAMLSRDGFWDTESSQVSREPINGTLVYKAGAFETFRALVDFILAAKELYFLYCPLGAETYHKKVKLAYIDKAARDGGGWMEAPVSFDCLSQWYLPRDAIVEISGAGDNALRLPFRLDGTTRLPASASEAYTATVYPEGHIPAAIRLEYQGNAVNPVITLTGETTGTVYGECAIDAAIQDGETLVLDTSYNDSRCYLTSGGTETDLIAHVDISKNPFFRVPTKEPCKIAMHDDGAMAGDARVSVKYYYRSV